VGKKIIPWPITGRVLDATQAAITSAAVTVTNQETGIRTATRTSETGNYVVPQLPVGRYEITFEATGFNKAIQRDIDLNVAQTLTLNITLQVGQVDQQVEVTAAAPLLESSTSDLGTVVNRDRDVEPRSGYCTLELVVHVHGVLAVRH